MELGTHHRRYISQNGRWASSFDALADAGAQATLQKDGWGKDFDLREGFVVSAGPDRKWETSDDLWIDVEAMELGGKTEP